METIKFCEEFKWIDLTYLVYLKGQSSEILIPFFDIYIDRPEYEPLLI